MADDQRFDGPHHHHSDVRQRDRPREPRDHAELDA
jgi:hypothetical protein